MKFIHEPVLSQEVLEYLAPKPNENFIDCTFGGGGHALALLAKVRPGGQVIGIDLDERAIENFGRKAPGLILVNDNYKNIRKIILDKKDELGRNDKISGVLLDLGLSSDQLGSGDRGFSFQAKEFLDLRFSKVSQPVSASDMLRTASEQELVDIFKNYGEERLARPIAKKIIAHRVVDNHAFDSSTLASLVADIYKRFYKDAERLLNKCITVNSSNPLYYCSLGDSFISMGKIQNALEAYDKAIQYDDSRAAAYYNRLGNSLMKTDNFSQAADAFQSAIKYEPDRHYYSNLASAYRGMGLAEQADMIMCEVNKIR